MQHREIKLEHGINTSCFNCHHETNRDAFAGEEGEEIPWNQPQLLCAKCHGPVYRDWQHGSHGRTNGYWDTQRACRRGGGALNAMIRIEPPFPDLQSGSATAHAADGADRATGRAATLNPLRLERQRHGAAARRTVNRDAGRGPERWPTCPLDRLRPMRQPRRTGCRGRGGDSCPRAWWHWRALSAVAGAVSPLRHLDPDDLPSLEQFLQKHYKEMTPEDKEQVFARIAQAVQQRFGVVRDDRRPAAAG